MQNPAYVQTMIALASAAFGVVAALAWNSAITALVKQIFGSGGQIVSLFIYAIIITIVAAIGEHEVDHLMTGWGGYAPHLEDDAGLAVSGCIQRPHRHPRTEAGNQHLAGGGIDQGGGRQADRTHQPEWGARLNGDRTLPVDGAGDSDRHLVGTLRDPVRKVVAIAVGLGWERGQRPVIRVDLQLLLVRR